MPPHRKGRRHSTDPSQHSTEMKSAYELAMERLEKHSPTAKLTKEQKAAIAEIESAAKAKVAEKEVFLKDQMTKATAQGKFDEVLEL